jgi:hypothetical protein
MCSVTLPPSDSRAALGSFNKLRVLLIVQVPQDLPAPGCFRRVVHGHQVMTYNGLPEPPWVRPRIPLVESASAFFLGQPPSRS